MRLLPAGTVRDGGGRRRRCFGGGGGGGRGRRKRGRREAGGVGEEGAGGVRDDDDDPRLGSAVTERRGRTVAKERQHPEEALFLHLRELLRIVSSSNEDDDGGGYHGATTCKHGGGVTDPTSLSSSTTTPGAPEPLVDVGGGYDAANYDVISPSLTDVGETTSDGKSAATVGEKRLINDVDREVALQGDGERGSGDDGTFATPSEGRPFTTRALWLQLSDDVATAPPPWVVTREGNMRTIGPGVRLAYYAYNLNAHFRRSDPGLPDFGVAVMPFNDNQPTFDALNSLVPMSEGADDNIGDATSGIPLVSVSVGKM